MKEDAYYYESVLWAYYHDPQITTGVWPGSFGTEGGCTRAQVVTFLWRAFGMPDPASQVCAFTDVPEDAYYRTAVLWAVENGITNGLTDTEFGPDATCTRAQIATFLWRAMGKSLPTNTSCPFTDVKAGAWYYQPVLWAVGQGVTNGTSETTFSPDDTCTRGQVVTFLYRALKE